MAKSQQVKNYLAYWFQLGKKIIHISQDKSFKPQKVLIPHGYSSEFEKIWTLVSLKNQRYQYYLEGTSQTIEDLFSSKWDIVECARCSMPIPILEKGHQKDNTCICNDLDNWPNNKLPRPRLPANTQEKLTRIQKSLMNKEKESLAVRES